MIAMTFPTRAGRNARATLSMPFKLPVGELKTRPDDAAIAGARESQLTAEQRQRLARCARRAYDCQAELGLTGEAAFDAWRHEVVREATGRAGLRELTQREYGPVMARLIELAGGSPSRREWHAAAKPLHRDDADRARHALKDECDALAESFGGAAQADAYATSLLSRIHRTDWMSATARQLWQVLFTLRNRARARDRAGCPARRLPSGPCREASGGDEAASRAFAVETGALAAGRGGEDGGAGPDGAEKGGGAA